MPSDLFNQISGRPEALIEDFDEAVTQRRAVQTPRDYWNSLDEDVQDLLDSPRHGIVTFNAYRPYVLQVVDTLKCLEGLLYGYRFVPALRRCLDDSLETAYAQLHESRIANQYRTHLEDQITNLQREADHRERDIASLEYNVSMLHNSVQRQADALGQARREYNALSNRLASNRAGPWPANRP